MFNVPPRYNLQERKGKINVSYFAYTKAIVELKKYRDIFYPERVKIIPPNIGDYFTPKSLAYMYMDDGNLSKKNSLTIALCNFDFESLTNFTNLLGEWGIKTSISKNFEIYIKAESREDFRDLIKPYIIPNMKYKLSL